MIRIVVTGTASSRNQSLSPDTNEPSKIWTSFSGTARLVDELRIGLLFGAELAEDAEDLEHHRERDVDRADAGLDHALEHVQQALADVLQRLDRPSSAASRVGWMNADCTISPTVLPSSRSALVRLSRACCGCRIVSLDELSDRGARGEQLRRDLLHDLERPGDGPADQVCDRGSRLEQALDDRPQPVERVRRHPREDVADRVLQPLRHLAEQFERGVAGGGGPPEHLA